MGSTFRYENHTHASSVEDSELFDDCEEGDIEQTLCCESSSNSPVIGDGLVSVTNDCTPFSTPQHPDMVVYDTPGFDDSHGAHMDTLHSLQMSQCIRQHQDIRVALVVPVGDVISYTNRTHLKSNESFLCGVAEFIQNRPQNFDGIKLLLSKFETPEQPKGQIKVAFNALKTVVRLMDGPNDIDSRVLPVLKFMEQSIERSLRAKRTYELVIVPACRSPQEIDVAENCRRLIWEALKHTPTIPSGSVGLPLNPHVISTIENACLKYLTDIQTELASDSGMNGIGVYDQMSDLRILHRYADIDKVHECYWRSVNIIAEFALEQFRAANISLDKQEYVSAAEHLRKAGSLGALQRLSTLHCDGALHKIDQHWQGAQKRINSTVTSLVRETTSAETCFASLVPKLSALLDISEYLQSYLQSSNGACYANVIQHIRSQIDATHGHAIDLVNKRNFVGHGLDVDVKVLADAQCLSPRFVDDGGRLEMVKGLITIACEHSIQDFKKKGSSVTVVVDAMQECDTTQRAVSIIDDIVSNFSTCLPTDVTVQAEHCLQQTSKLRDDVLHSFRQELKLTCAVAHKEPVSSTDAPSWEQVAISYKNLVLVCKLQIGGNSGDKIFQRESDALVADIQALCVGLCDGMQNSQGADFDCIYFSRYCTHVANAKQAFATCGNINTACMESIQAELNQTVATACVSLNATVHDTITSAETFLGQGDVCGLAPDFEFLNALISSGLAAFVDEYMATDVSQSCVEAVRDLVRRTVACVERSCHESKNLISQIQIAERLTPEQVVEITKCMHVLAAHEDAMTHLVSRAPFLNLGIEPLHQGLAEASTLHSNAPSVNADSRVHVTETAQRATETLFDACIQKLQTARKTVSIAIYTYAVACRQRCFSAINDDDIRHAQSMMDSLAMCKMTFDAMLDKERCVAAVLETTHQDVRNVFNDVIQTTKQAMATEDLVTAEQSIHRLQRMEPLYILFTEVNVESAVAQLVEAYSTKQDDFGAKTMAAMQDHRFEDLATLLLGNTSDRCRDHVCRIWSYIMGNITATKSLIEVLSQSPTVELPPHYANVANAVHWLGCAHPLAKVFSDLGPQIERLHGWVNEFIEQIFQRGILAAEEFRFSAVHSARESLHKHIQMDLMVDTVKTHLENLDKIVTETIASLPQTLTSYIGSKNRVAIEIDTLFDELTLTKNIVPQTESTRALSKMNASLRRTLDIALRELCEAVKEAYVQHDVKAGKASFDRLRLLMTSQTCKDLLYDNDDIGIPYLRELRKQIVGEMFHPKWFKENAAGDLRGKMMLLKAVGAVEFRRLTSEFTYEHVEKPTLKTIDQLTSFSPRCLKEVATLMQNLPIYADVLTEQATTITDFVHLLESATAESISEALDEASSAMRSGHVEKAVLTFGPFLKMSPDVLAQAVALEASSKTGWRSEFKSTESARLQPRVKFFLEENLLMGQDASDIEGKWDRLIEQFDLLELTPADAAELCAFVSDLHARQLIFSRMFQLSPKVSHPEAIKKLTSKLSNNAVNAIAQNVLQACKFDTLATLLTACKLLQQVEEPNLAPLCTEASTFVLHSVTQHVSRLEENAAQWYSDAMSPTILLRDRDVRIAKINSALETIGRITRTCGMSGLASKALEAITRSSSLKKDAALTYIETSESKSEAYHEKVAEYLVALYEIPAAISNEEIKAHAHKCNEEILTAFSRRKRKGCSISTLDDRLREHDLGHEIIDSHNVFSHTRLEKLRKAMATLSEDAAMTKVIDDNHLSKEQGDHLKASWKQYNSEFMKHMQHSVRGGAATIAQDALRDFRMSTSNYRKNVAQLIGKICAVWSLEKSPRGEAAAFLQPHAAQILAIFRLLQLDASHDSSLVRMLATRIFGSKDGNDKPPNHLAQVQTGQGKSVVLGVTATVLAVLGYHVDCACYSKYLSERDMADFLPVFSHFNVQDSIVYGTFSQLAETMINQHGSIRGLTGKVVNPNEQGRFGHAHGQSPTPKQRVVLIDEVDVFFSDDFYGKTYNPLTIFDGPDILKLFHQLWKNRSASSEALRKLVFDSKQYHALIARLARDSRRDDLIRKHFEKSIDDLKVFLDQHQSASGFPPPHKVIKGMICYKSLDTYTSSTYYGYTTLWTYFHEHTADPTNVTVETLECQCGLQLGCGNFSFAEVPKDYLVILGVTGTLEQSLRQPFEKRILEEEYNIHHQTLMPSMFGDSKLEFREKDHVVVENDTDTHYRKILEEVQQNSDLGRPVLVYFESEHALQEWHESPYGQSLADNVVACITASTPNKEHYVQRASRAGMVTLLSREHGRGLDFKNTSDKVDALKGIHIVQTFLSEHPSEEVQIKGRTARMGKNGTYVMVLHVEHLKTFSVTKDEIDELRKGGEETIYARLCKKRLETLEKKNARRATAVQQALETHKSSMAYREHLVAAIQSNCTDQSAVDHCLDYLLSVN